MRVPKDQVDVKLGIPGAALRQRTDFGHIGGVGTIGAEYFTFSVGVDTAAHNVKVEADAEIVMFSPQREHSQVINHMIAKVTG